MLERYLPKGKRTRMLILMLVDVFAVLFSSYMGLLVRFDFTPNNIPQDYLQTVMAYSWIYVICTIVIFLLFHLYSIMWSAAGIREVFHIIGACGLSSLVQIAGMMMMQHGVPRSYYIICFSVLTISETFIRLSYRILQTIENGRGGKTGKKILIAGAGSSGAVILKEMQSSAFAQGHVVCFVDDDKNKIGKYLNGVPIEGSREDIPRLAKKYAIDEIFIAMPSAPAKETKKILEICRETDCKLKILPGIYQLLNGEVSIAKLREVQIEDLLGREPIRVKLDEIMGYVGGKVVLVTGGGGSIGSELCRQIASHSPKQLIVFDIY